MNKNKFNASKSERFQIDCGTVHGIVNARTEGSAFRKLLNDKNKGVDDFGQLARFRVIIVGHGKRIFKRSRWFYQDPWELMRTL